jgi:hypothetical protein
MIEISFTINLRKYFKKIIFRLHQLDLKVFKFLGLQKCDVGFIIFKIIQIFINSPINGKTNL